jgi:hypothetical protein
LFAVGDVRAGSVNRVGGAIGEGAQVVAALHGFLGDAETVAVSFVWRHAFEDRIDEDVQRLKPYRRHSKR